MAAEIVRLDRADPGQAFSRCRDVVREGGVIVFPTETFYGIGADPRNPQAIERIFAIKGRNAEQPILVLLKDREQVPEWAAHVPSEAERLMKQYWPGPLTLVFKAQPQVLPALTGGTGSIGLRVPGSEVTRALLRFLGSALTGTSANRSGQGSASTAQEAAFALGDVVDLILDAGASPGGKESTVVDVRGLPVKVIRQGALDVQL